MSTQLRAAPTGLAERFQQGDPGALGEIYHHYQRPMFATAMRMLGSRELAADAVQQAFVQVWRASASFDSSRELRPWLYAIVRRTAVDVHRQERRSGGAMSIDAVPEERLAGPETATLEGRWRAWQVHQALARLPEHDRQVLKLAHFGGLTQAEIAERLDVPVGTVKSRLTRAYRRLARLLGHVVAS